MSIKIKLILGDSKNMEKIEDNSTELILGSPLYDHLVKTYSDKNEDIANSKSYEDYLMNMKKVFEECYRVLKPGRYICVNISHVLREGVRINVPAHTAILLEEVGFECMEDIIWKKEFGRSGFPRFANWLKKGHKPMTYKCANIYEHILVYRKPGEAVFEHEGEGWEKFDNCPMWLMSDVWRIATDTKKLFKFDDLTVEHPAIFHQELPELLIKMFSFKGETVLDPFLGSGTTLIVARDLKRNGIGIDISEEYIELSKKRIGWGQQFLGDDDVKYEVI